MHDIAEDGNRLSSTRGTKQLRSRKPGHQTETETFVSHYSSGLRLDSKKKTHSDVVRRKPLRSCGYQQLGSAQAVTPVQSPSSNRFSHFDYEGLGSMNRKTCRADCVPRSPIHRRQNCHGSSCHYCLSDNTGSLISNCCALDADSGSSTDKEDQYPSIYVANNAKRMTQSYHEQGNTVARDQAPEIVSEEEMMNSKRNTGVSHVIPIIVGSRTPVRKELQIIHEPTSLRQSSYNQDYSSAALCQRIPSTYNQQEQCQRQQEHLRRDQMRSQSHATVTTMCTNTITENAHYIPVTSERKIPIRSKPRQVTIDRIPITFIHEPMIQDGSSYPLTKRAMSHTNVYGPRSWNLRSRQGSESDLAVRRVTSVSSSAGRSSYSAHRERIRQEREQELLMRQQQMQRQRQMAASTTGLHEHSLQHQSRHQQQYRSLSAVNQNGGSEAFEEIETIILQPIGRGVQDIDSRVGSMTTLARAPGGSLIDGLHRVDDGQRSGLTRRGFSSTQFLHRNTSNSDISRPTTLSQQQVPLSAQTIGASRFGTVSATPQMSGSRSQLSTTSSTIIAPASAAPIPITNGWKNEPTKSTFSDVADGANNLSIVQETAPAWYRPTLSREAAISILRQQPPGSFLIRDSTTFKDAFGLAVKVATLPPKVTPKSDDLQSELVRHYLIEVVNAPNKGVRLKGFASEPVFASLAALIHQHTIDPLALPCRLILPPIPAHIPSSGTAALPAIVIGSSPKSHVLPTNPQTLADLRGPMDHTTVTSGGSVLCGGAPSESGSAQIDGLSANAMNSVTPVTRVDGGTSSPITNDGIPTASSPNVPFVCVLHENPPEMEGQLSQGLTFRCLMLGSVDTPQWSMEMCFSRAVDQLIPLTLLTAADCDRGVSRVRYTEVQLHVSSHDGITIIDLQRRLFLRRHLPNHVLMYCGIETRKKEFSHPEHKLHGIVNPKIFGIVVRKGISECTTHIFTECDPIHTTDSIVRHIRETYPHMNVR